MPKINKNKKSGMKAGKVLAAGAGMAALGAGAYYLFGPDGKKNQKKATALMNKIKKEVENKVGKVEKVGVPVYHKVVDVVSENYAREYQAHEKDIKAFAKKLKSEWKKVSGKPAQKKTSLAAKKKVKKVK